MQAVLLKIFSSYTSLFIIHHKSHIMYFATHLTNIFKASCVPIVIHSSVTFCYYNNLSVTEYSPYHSQLMFHTLYFFIHITTFYILCRMVSYS